MEIWIVPTLLAITNNGCYEHSLSTLCVDIGFFICLGKYLQVELPGYMRVSVCAVPPQEASKARSLLPPRQINLLARSPDHQISVFCFRCCDDCLLLTATSISDQPQASCSVGLPLTTTKI